MDDAAPPSPCTGICAIEAATDTCRGCGRTLDEIAEWPTASAAEKRGILARIDGLRNGQA